jgi:hypothetical protein
MIPSGKKNASIQLDIDNKCVDILQAIYKNIASGDEKNGGGSMTGELAFQSGMGTRVHSGATLVRTSLCPS